MLSANVEKYVLPVHAYFDGTRDALCAFLLLKSPAFTERFLGSADWEGLVSHIFKRVAECVLHKRTIVPLQMRTVQEAVESGAHSIAVLKGHYERCTTVTLKPGTELIGPPDADATLEATLVAGAGTVIVGLTLQLAGGAGIIVSGDAEIESCRILRNPAAGVIIDGEHRVVLTGNVIHGNRWSGLRIPGAGASIVMQRNVITGNGGYGIHVPTTKACDTAVCLRWISGELSGNVLGTTNDVLVGVAVA
mmetsp:Transcript_1716/g.3800  ORF Transcript_1716/g.3800 Transcript_1716/m.3800 type:complete len:249 (+) Transcript_1716:54-800(+)